ncbi:MAG: 4Fe-4S dicluster domain-containing protein [Nocardioidaceae bacterium]|nr:4Fe-4S dicluster domain-containing protein [Nocardioidaceae bacterium]
MTTLVDTNLLAALQEYGAADVSACFSCGNCTAICPLADNDATFPRRIIRYAQVGMTEELLSSKELWTCYHCGMCSDSCPTEADPGEFMAAARRYVTASYDKTRIAKVLYTMPILGTVVSLVAFFLLAGFLYTSSDIMPTKSLELFTFVPYHVVHWLGIGIMAVVVLTGLAGMASMARGMAKKEGVTWKSLVENGEARKRTVKALWFSIGIESIGQRRYREDCLDDRPVEPWYRRRWFIHAMTIWGFIGLLIATSLDYGLDVIGVKETGTAIPIWYPSRAIGTIGGLMLMYGVTFFMVNRMQKYNRAATVSKPSDWMFLILLWVTGFTGFLIEVALYVPPTPAWGYWVFLVHVAIAMELLLFVPFTKFAHVIYRPVALFFYSLSEQKTLASA